MNRRTFLKSAACASAISVPFAFPPKAYAWVQVATSVISIGLSVANYMSKGPGIADMLNTQMEAIKELSDQIQLVQEGIITLLENVSKMEELIGKVPANVVKELSERSILGGQISLIELIEAYNEEKTISGPNQAKETYRPLIYEEVLRPVKKARTDLMSYKTPYSVPLMAVALKTEIDGCILSGLPSSYIKSVLNSYERWFADFEKEDSDLRSRITKLRAERSALMNENFKDELKDWCIFDEPLPFSRHEWASNIALEHGMSPHYLCTFENQTEGWFFTPMRKTEWKVNGDFDFVLEIEELSPMLDNQLLLAIDLVSKLVITDLKETVSDTRRLYCQSTYTGPASNNAPHATIIEETENGINVSRQSYADNVRWHSQDRYCRPGVNYGPNRQPKHVSNESLRFYMADRWGDPNYNIERWEATPPLNPKINERVSNLDEKQKFLSESSLEVVTLNSFLHVSAESRKKIEYFRTII